MTHRGRERSYHGDKEAVAGSHQPHSLQGRLHRFLQFLFLPPHIWTQSWGEPSHHLCSSLMAPWSGVIGVPVDEAGVASQRKMLQTQSTLRWKRWRRPPLLTMLYSQMLALYSRLFLCPLHTAEGPVQMTLRQRQHRCSSHLNFLTLQFTKIPDCIRHISVRLPDDSQAIKQSSSSWITYCYKHWGTSPKLDPGLS